MFVIILVHLFCTFPRLVMDVVRAVYESYDMHMEDNKAVAKWWFLILIVSNFFLTINSSINTIIYCAFNDKFRKDVFQILGNLCCWFIKLICKFVVTAAAVTLLYLIIQALAHVRIKRYDTYQ